MTFPINPMDNELVNELLRAPIKSSDSPTPTSRVFFHSSLLRPASVSIPLFVVCSTSNELFKRFIKAYLPAKPNS